MILAGHGLRLALPTGWSGRLFSRQPGAATLHAGSFPIALGDGEFGDASTAAIPPGGAFLALVEYVPDGSLRPAAGLFASRRIPRRLDPTAFTPAGLAHPRPGQAGAQHFFTAHGRPFCLYVVLAAGRRQLAVVQHVLGSVRIEPR